MRFLLRNWLWYITKENILLDFNVLLTVNEFMRIGRTMCGYFHKLNKFQSMILFTVSNQLVAEITNLANTKINFISQSNGTHKLSVAAGRTDTQRVFDNAHSCCVLKFALRFILVWRFSSRVCGLDSESGLDISTLCFFETFYFAFSQVVLCIFMNLLKNIWNIRWSTPQISNIEF